MSREGTDAPRAGVAILKPEFILPRAIAPTVEVIDDDAAEEGGKSTKRGAEDAGDDQGGKAAKGNDGRMKKQGGMNKGRKFETLRDDVQLCQKYAADRDCSFGNDCRRSHDLSLYFASKPADLPFPRRDWLSESAPFVQDPATTTSSSSLIYCPTFEELGYCPQGFKCRYLSAHQLAPVAPETIGDLVVNEEKKAAEEPKGLRGETNWVPAGIMKDMRSNRYAFPIADRYLLKIDGQAPIRKGAASILAPKAVVSEEEMMNEQDEEEMAAASKIDADKDIKDGPMRPEEKKRLNWEGKTYLAPLTTTGNLPFRRLCVSLGADITCSEMGLASSFLQGAGSEWALTKRHESEKNFGVQVCGSKTSQLVPAAEAIVNQCPDVDFVDVNLGCPIDLVFNKGAGSALFDAPGKLGKILVGMSRALGSVPLTVKMRTGIKDRQNTAHKLIPRFATEWGVNGMTIHGRSRQQRYSRLADWEYIKECTETLRASCDEANLPRVPIFGNGDCFSSQQYYESLESGVDGLMVARGALIKPWIFTEIKERREWDISAVERLEFIRKFAEFGITHWGSDTEGINKTRRYLCESISFTHRYIPLGLLETLPGKINERAPPFKGRNELETLLASSDSRDWVKLSEMFLGPSPDDFSFLPKHKSSSQGSTEEGNG
ncbi:hypothetical protein BDY24DRAFT_384976 [Mrakia frigida]|uniref:tRNA dihydrouridine synthase DUS3 n=1 Tax=Mrakia frigida TaxID=29902 RepID=UPI003FCC20E2